MNTTYFPLFVDDASSEVKDHMQHFSRHPKCRDTHVQDDGEAWWTYLTQDTCVLPYTPPIFYTLLQIIEKRIIKKAFSSSWSAGTMVLKMVEEEHEFEVRLHRHIHTRSRWIKEEELQRREVMVGWHGVGAERWKWVAEWCTLHLVLHLSCKIATFMFENWIDIDS